MPLSAKSHSNALPSRRNPRNGLAARVALPALFAASMLAPACHAQEAGPAGSVATARPWQIVSLNGTDPTLPAFIAIDTALRAALLSPSAHPAILYAETLDMYRFSDAQMEQDLASLLARKYARRHIDAVIATAGPGLRFALQYRDALWPGAPIIYHSVAQEVVAQFSPAAGVTGVPVHFAAVELARMALRARPDARRLVVISGSGEGDRQIGAVIRSQIEAASLPVTVEFWYDRRVEDVMAGIAALPSTDAVLYVIMSRDSTGRITVPREIMRQMSAVSRAPIYSLFETYSGAGMTAGLVDDYARRGNVVADLVTRVLKAPPGAPLPVVAAPPPACVADARQLERLGIARDAFPADCSILFEQRSLWHEYRSYVLAAVAVVFAQAALVLALVLQRRGRRKAEAEAHARTAELAQASRLALAGELTASIAHEINQPLGAIQANAGAAEALLRRGRASEAELREILADIRKANVRASEIVRHTRALISAGPGVLAKVDVNALVSDVLGFLAPEARLRGVALSRQLAADLPAVEGDRIQLQQMLVNLCINGMEAMEDNPAPRRLRIRTRAAQQGGVEIIVSDAGPGISPEAQSRIFDSFFTTKRHGTGLGLSLTRSIVEAHGGTIAVANGDAGGAVFTIALPGAGQAAPDPGGPPGRQGVRAEARESPAREESPR